MLELTIIEGVKNIYWYRKDTQRKLSYFVHGSAIMIICLTHEERMMLTSKLGNSQKRTNHGNMVHSWQSPRRITRQGIVMLYNTKIQSARRVKFIPYLLIIPAHL